jgi:hypothetical protein
MRKNMFNAYAGLTILFPRQSLRMTLAFGGGLLLSTLIVMKSANLMQNLLYQPD